MTDGRLDLGPWQQIYYAEFDRQRKKRALIKVIGESELWAGAFNSPCSETGGRQA